MCRSLTLFRALTHALATAVAVSAQNPVPTAPRASAPVAVPARPPIRADFKPPGPPDNAPAPWLTKATEIGGSKNHILQHRMYVPTKEKVDQVFYDLPVAVHIPVEIPFDGGVVNTFLDLDAVWGEPEVKARLPQYGGRFSSLEENGPPPWISHGDGVYRLDGAPIEEGTVGWELLRGDVTQFAPFTWQTRGPVPLMFNGKPIEMFKPGEGANPGRHLFADQFLSGPRVPFALREKRDGDGWNFHYDPTPVQFRKAKPGWYVFWFVVSSPYPFGVGNVPIRPDGTVQVKIRAHTLVTRLQRITEPNSPRSTLSIAEQRYLWEGRGEKPARLAVDQLTRAHTTEVPMTFHPDGWVLDRVEARPGGSREYLLKEKAGAAAAATFTQYPLEFSGAAQASGNGASIKGRMDVMRWEYSSGTPRAIKAAQRDVTFDVRLPARILDGGIGELTLTRTVVAEQGDLAVLRQVSDPLALRHVSRSDDYNGAWLSAVANNDYVGDKTRYLAEHAWKYGDAAGLKWLPYTKEPPASGVPWVFRFGGRHHRVQDAHSAEEFKIVEEDVGPMKLFAVECGPWIVEGHYRRLKDAANRGSAIDPNAVARVVEEKDPFWEWYPKHSRLLRDQLALVAGGSRSAAAFGERRAQLARTRARLLGALQGTETSWADVFQSAAPLAPGDLQTKHTRRRVQEITAELDVLRARISEIARTTQAAFERIDADITKTFWDPKLKEHFELSIWQSHWRKQAAQAKLRLALAFGDPGTFQEFVASLEGAALDADTRMMEASMLAQTGDMVGAWWALRRAAQVAPDRADVAERLRDLEVAFLRTAMEKSQGVIRDARKHFETYLGERGFNAREPNKPSPERDGWVAAIKAPFSESSREYALASITTGIVGSLSAILGDKPESEARTLAATETQMTTAWLGLQAILRLRLQGLTFGEIAKLNTGGLEAALTPRNVRGVAYDARQLRQLAVAIREALKLPEVQALVASSNFRPARAPGDTRRLLPGDYAADRADLDRGVAAGYWDPKDVGNTWAEWFGDITSAKNLVMLCLPHAVGRVGGGTLEGAAFWSTQEAQIVASAAQAGRVELGVPVVARMIGWDRAVETLGATGGGQWVLEGLERSIEYQQGLGSFDRRLWTASKALGGYLLSYSAQQAAKEKGGPWADLFVEGITLFAGDTERMKKLLAAGRRDYVREAARAIREQYLPQAQRQVVNLNAWRSEVKQLVDALEAQKAGKTLTDAHLKYLARYEVGQSARRIPNGLPSHDADIARHGASDALARNTRNGAFEAAETLGPDVTEEIAALQRSNQAVDDAITAIGDLGETVGAPALAVRPVAADRVVKNFVIARFAEPPRLQTGSALAEVQLALADRDGKKAAALLRELIADAREAAAAGKPLTRQEYPLAVLELQLQAAENIGQVAKLPRPSGVGAYAAEIADEELEAALRLPRKSLLEAVGEKPGATGSVAVAGTGQNRFAVKSIRYGEGTNFTDAEHVKRVAMEGEIVGGAVARALGIDVAASRLVVNESTREVLVVSRWIDGVRVDGLTPEQLLEIAPQLTEQKLFAQIIGNYDWKPDNVKLAGGRVAAFDLGAAATRGAEHHPMSSMLPLEGPDVFQGFWGRDHWVGRAYYYLSEPELAANLTPELRAFYAKIMFIESQLDARHTQSLIAKLKDFTAGNSVKARAAFERGFREVYRDEAKVRACVDQAVHELERKMLQIEPSAMEWNLRNGLPPPPSNLDITSPGLRRVQFTPRQVEEFVWRIAA